MSQLARHGEGSKVPRYRLLILILLGARAVMDALAAFGGDFDALVALLDPAVVLRSDFAEDGPARPKITRGAAAVASQARLGRTPGRRVAPALVNGVAGVVITVRGLTFPIMGSPSPTARSYRSMPSPILTGSEGSLWLC